MAEAEAEVMGAAAAVRVVVVAAEAVATDRYLSFFNKSIGLMTPITTSATSVTNKW